MTCTIAGCDRQTIARQLCGKHYQAWRKTAASDQVRATNYGTGRAMKDGYVRVWEPGHPMASGDGYVREHRKVVYDAGIPIPAGHDVHHLNEDPSDNRLENLVELDSLGLLDNDGDLVLGLLCELSDQCLFPWRAA